MTTATTGPTAGSRIVGAVRDPALAAVLDAVAVGVARLAALLAGADARTSTVAVGDRNPSGDAQVALDLIAHELFVDVLRGAPVCAVASEEADHPVTLDASQRYAVAIDPLDGSANIAIDAPAGAIFSVIDTHEPAGPHAPTDVDGTTAQAAGRSAAAFIGDGRRIVASGFSVFGSRTLLVIATGGRVDVHRLVPGTERFELEVEGVTIPDEAHEYAINASNHRHWAPGMRRYVDDLVAGAAGPRATDFNMRWLAALVAEAFRILIRGGIYLYPGDMRRGYEHGRLRLLYEGHPIAYLVETAGGAATDGDTRLLDVAVTDLHQRSPLVFGSSRKVARAREYHLEPFDASRSPLFARRGLFRS